MYHIFFILSSVDGYLTGSVTSLLETVQSCGTPAGLVAGSGVYFHGDCICLHFHQQCMRALPHQYLFSHSSCSGWGEMESLCHFNVPFPLTAEGAKHFHEFICHLHSMSQGLAVHLTYSLTNWVICLGGLWFFFTCSFYNLDINPVSYLAVKDVLPYCKVSSPSLLFPLLYRRFCSVSN